MVRLPDPSFLSVTLSTDTSSFSRYPTEKLTRKQALKGATLDAAYASFTEDILGSLTPGKRADYVVLDRDIVDETTPVAEILRTTVLATVVDGQIAYGEI